jgi:hypothetical protein
VVDDYLSSVFCTFPAASRWHAGVVLANLRHIARPSRLKFNLQGVTLDQMTAVYANPAMNDHFPHTNRKNLQSSRQVPANAAGIAAGLS